MSRRSRLSYAAAKQLAAAINAKIPSGSQVVAEAREGRVLLFTGETNDRGARLYLPAHAMRESELVMTLADLLAKDRES